MNTGYADITLILDKSGSMGPIWSDVVGGIDTFVKEQQKEPGKCLFSLIAFDDKYEEVFIGKHIGEVKPLSDIGPRGNTALLDAIGKTINTLGERLRAIPEIDRPGKVVVIIQTDGAENASHEFTKAKIIEMVEHQTETYNWQFVFFGANMDAIQAGAGIGVIASSSVNWQQSSIGTSQLYGGLSKKMSAYRGGSCSGMAFTQNEKEEIEKDTY